MDKILKKIGEINPTDTRLIERIKNLEGNQYQQLTARQPFWDDWYTLNNTEFTYENAVAHNGSLTVGDVDTAIFSQGDRFRIKFAGDSSYRYFALTVNKATKIYLSGDYTKPIVNLAITEIAYSKFVAPTGFPTYFDYLSNAAGFSSYAEVSRYWLVGSVVYLDVVVSGTSNANNLNIDSPVNNTQITKSQFVNLVDNSSNVTGKKTTAFFLQTPPVSGGTPYSYTNKLIAEIDYNTSGFTSSNDKSLQGNVFYQLLDSDQFI